MASLLVSEIKKRIASGFKGRLTTGVIRREAVASINSYGDKVAGPVSNFTFEGIRQNFTALYKSQALIPDTDVSILVLLGSVKPAMSPIQSDKIYLNAPWLKWHQVRRILEVDPAGASMLLQCYEIKAP